MSDFRTILAESGIEMTPDEAFIAKKKIKKLIRLCKRMDSSEIYKASKIDKSLFELILNARDF